MTRRLSFCFRAILVLSTISLGSALASGATENILYNFRPRLHGLQPSGGLITDAAGNLYGATFWGGSYGLGTVFELTPNSHGGWSETVLYSFMGGSDVYAPYGSLVFDAACSASSRFRVDPGLRRCYTPFPREWDGPTAAGYSISPAISTEP
jgi:uncharacterized repeat protein (TIGR03803 family)